MLEFIQTYILPKITADNVQIYLKDIHHEQDEKRLTATFHLGVACLLGHLIEKNSSKGLDLLMDCYFAGQHFCGISEKILENALDLIKAEDLLAAYEHFKEKSRSNQPADIAKLAMCHEFRIANPQYRMIQPNDRIKMVELLSGCDLAFAQWKLYRSRVYYRATDEKRQDMLIQLCARGYPPALVEFGSLCLIGVDRWMHPDEKKAVDNLKKAGKAGNAQAQHLFSKQLVTDAFKFKLNQLGASQYHLESLRSLADCYESGLGVNQNAQQAKYYRDCLIALISAEPSVFKTKEEMLAGEQMVNMSEQGSDSPEKAPLLFSSSKPAEAMEVEQTARNRMTKGL